MGSILVSIWAFHEMYYSTLPQINIQQKMTFFHFFRMQIMMLIVPKGVSYFWMKLIKSEPFLAFTNSEMSGAKEFNKVNKGGIFLKEEIFQPHLNFPAKMT